MVTAPPGTYLAEVCRRVARLSVGECVAFPARELRQNIARFHHNGADFTPPDRALGNIVGAAYTHSFRISFRPPEDVVIFQRHENTGRRYYEEPDRRGRNDA